MENHHLCQASIVIQQPTSVTALESGAVFQEAGGYCSTTGGPSHVPTTASTGVEATRIMSKVIVIVNSIVLAFYVFMHIGGDFAGPIVALHVLSSVIGIAIGRKARRSFSKSSFKLAALVFALEFAMYAVFLWIWFVIAREMRWNAQNIEGYDIPVGVMAFVIVPDMISAGCFLLGFVSAFVAICKWRENADYETGGAETSPV